MEVLLSKLIREGSSKLKQQMEQLLNGEGLEVYSIAFKGKEVVTVQQGMLSI